MVCASDRLYFPPYYSDFWMNSNGKRSVGKPDPCSAPICISVAFGILPLIITTEKTVVNYRFSAQTGTEMSVPSLAHMGRDKRESDR